jgi:hypothetical protein
MTRAKESPADSSRAFFYVKSHRSRYCQFAPMNGAQRPAEWSLTFTMRPWDCLCVGRASGREWRRE